MTNRTIQFRNILESLKTATDIEEHRYIGTGNPLADILIVGKECGFDCDKTEQYKKEITKNHEYWCDLQDFDSSQIPERKYEEYHALYPYKGQLLIKDNKNNNGTSVTWMNYQKLINNILEDSDNKKINFHEHAFITELNSSPSKKTKNANTTSIIFRKENVLNSDFFRSFPIVIVSGVGYFNFANNVNEIEQIFDVEFTEKKLTSDNKQPYWVHYNADKSKLLINTYQLSIGVSGELLRAVARDIKASGLLK